MKGALVLVLKTFDISEARPTTTRSESLSAPLAVTGMTKPAWYRHLEAVYIVRLGSLTLWSSHLFNI